MKILFIIDSLGAGGAERSTELLACYLRRQGVNVKIALLDRAGVGGHERLKAEGFDLYFFSAHSFIGRVRELMRLIRAERPSVVHSVLFRSNMLTRAARIFRRFIHLESLVNTTYTVERFNDPLVNPYALRLYKWLDRLTANLLVDQFHSIARNVKEHYVKELGIDGDKIRVVYRGRKQTLQKTGFSSQGLPLRLVTVGRHDFQKGQIHLLYAVDSLVSRGEQVQLVILGREGTETSKMKEYVTSRGLQDNVRFEGYRTNVYEYLVDADLFVFPSLYEGLGGALIEAQAAGLPIACNDIPVLHEVVRNGENAIFFNSRDTDSLAGAIEFFVRDRQKLEEYGKRSLENFRLLFDEEVNHDRMLELYCELAGERRRSGAALKVSA